MALDGVSKPTGYTVRVIEYIGRLLELARDLQQTLSHQVMHRLGSHRPNARRSFMELKNSPGTASAFVRPDVLQYFVWGDV